MASTGMDGGGETHRLTVVLSGGVSLGAFHAGAVAQLGWFLAEWAELRREDPSLPQIFVDVVSGASAGAMTGGMLAHFIGSNYYETKPGVEGSRSWDFVKANFETWCGEGLDIRRLMEEDKVRPRTSFLSNQVLEEIAERSICDLDPALPAGQESLIFTCTLTSMSGIPRALSLPDVTQKRSNDGVRPTFNLTYRSRRDQATFMILGSSVPKSFGERGRWTYDTYEAGTFILVEPGSSSSGHQGTPRARLWGRFRGAALASGAFPFAWNPMVTYRSLGPYKGAADTFGQFKYMDGGVIDNMPLARGAIAVREFTLISGSGSPLTAERTYVLIGTQPISKAVSPIPMAGSREFGGPWRDEAFALPKVVMPMFEAMREQTFMDDLSMALSINRALEDRERHVWPLIDDQVARMSPEEVQKEVEKYRPILKMATMQLTGRKDLEKAEVGGEVEAFQMRSRAEIDTLTVEQKQIEQSIQDAYRQDVSPFDAARIGSFGMGAAEADLDDIDARNELRKLMKIAYDSWYDLLGKHKLAVLPVNPLVELQGQFLGAFGGFLSRRFMVGDFGHGLEQARGQLRSYVTGLLGGGALPRDVEALFDRAEGMRGDVLGLAEGTDFGQDVLADAETYYDPTRGSGGRSVTDLEPSAVKALEAKAWDRGLATGTAAFPGFLLKQEGLIRTVLAVSRWFGLAVAGFGVALIGLVFGSIWVFSGAMEGRLMLPLVLGLLLFALFLVCLLFVGAAIGFRMVLTPARAAMLEKVLAGLSKKGRGR